MYSTYERTDIAGIVHGGDPEGVHNYGLGCSCIAMVEVEKQPWRLVVITVIMGATYIL